MSERTRIRVASKSIEISELMKVIRRKSAKESRLTNSYTLKSEATASSDMLVPISQISQFHIPENNNIHSHYCEKL
jgi:hypothetical protein